MKAASLIRSSSRARASALPGLGLTLGCTLLYLGVVVLIPLTALVLRAADLSWSQYWATVTTPRALASARSTRARAAAIRSRVR
jgi:sulfate transport system permease protein